MKSFKDHVELNEKKGDAFDPPAVLVMKRKYIRQFPNKQKVAIYYVEKINKYITLPYSDMQWSESVAEDQQ